MEIIIPFIIPFIIPGGLIVWLSWRLSRIEAIVANAAIERAADD